MLLRAGAERSKEAAEQERMKQEQEKLKEEIQPMFDSMPSAAPANRGVFGSMPIDSAMSRLNLNLQSGSTMSPRLEVSRPR